MQTNNTSFTPDQLSHIEHRPPTITGRSKKLWRIDENTCLVRLIESLDSFTFERHAVIAGTGKLRLDFYDRAAAVLNNAGVPCSYLKRVDDTAYLANYVTIPPFEVIAKNRAVGSTVRKYPGLFPAEQPLPQPVVKFDYRIDPEDQPIGEDYLRALNLPIDDMRALAHKANRVLVQWLAPLDLWDICFILGFTAAGTIEIASEISPDCMRLRDERGSSLDKDLFRNGASDAEVISRWQALINHVR